MGLNVDHVAKHNHKKLIIKQRYEFCQIYKAFSQHATRYGYSRTQQETRIAIWWQLVGIHVINDYTPIREIC